MGQMSRKDGSAGMNFGSICQMTRLAQLLGWVLCLHEFAWDLVNMGLRGHHIYAVIKTWIDALSVHSHTIGFNGTVNASFTRATAVAIAVNFIITAMQSNPDTYSMQATFDQDTGVGRVSLAELRWCSGHSHGHGNSVVTLGQIWWDLIAFTRMQAVLGVVR